MYEMVACQLAKAMDSLYLNHVNMSFQIKSFLYFLIILNRNIKIYSRGTNRHNCKKYFSFTLMSSSVKSQVYWMTRCIYLIELFKLQDRFEYMRTGLEQDLENLKSRKVKFFKSSQKCPKIFYIPPPPRTLVNSVQYGTQYSTVRNTNIFYEEDNFRSRESQQEQETW